MIRFIKFLARLTDVLFFMCFSDIGHYLEFRLNSSDDWAYRDLNKK